MSPGHGALESDETVPLTDSLAMSVVTCFHCTAFRNIPSIIEHGIVPGGDGGGRLMSFFSPYAPWDDRGQRVLPMKRMWEDHVVAIYIDAITMSRFGCYLDMDGHIMADKPIPFTEVQGMWYSWKNGPWNRFLAPNGGVYYVESAIGTSQVARRSDLFQKTVLVANYTSKGTAFMTRSSSLQEDGSQNARERAMNRCGEELNPEEEHVKIHRSSLSTRAGEENLPIMLARD